MCVCVCVCVGAHNVNYLCAHLYIYPCVYMLCVTGTPSRPRIVKLEQDGGRVVVHWELQAPGDNEYPVSTIYAKLLDSEVSRTCCTEGRSFEADLLKCPSSRCKYYAVWSCSMKSNRIHSSLRLSLFRNPVLADLGLRSARRVLE